MIDELNARFGVDSQLEFVAGEGGWPKAVIANEFCEGEIYLHGAHITEFQQKGAQPVLWLSPDAAFVDGKAIRGGIPICWPWFGPHPTDDSLPQHGFVRTADWDVVETTGDGDSTSIRMRISDSVETLAVWPHAFRLELLATFGRSLRVALTATNMNDASISVGGALHSYFSVAEIEKVSITGLEGKTYVDQLDSHSQKLQEGAIAIGEEVDRVYLNTDMPVEIVAASSPHRIQVVGEGSRSTVVWNPWIEKARRMGDFSNDGYKTMVCVETANAFEDNRQILPNDEHTLAQTISIG